MQLFKQYKYYLLLIILLFTLNSCQYLFERIIFNHPKNESFKYYTKQKKPNINKKLNTTSFYYHVGDALGGGDVLNYLAFKNDGTVINFSNTAMLPDTVYSYKSILYPKRKRNKTPRDISVDYGFYKTNGDSIFICYHQIKVLGAFFWYAYKGVVDEDEIRIDGIKYSQTYANDFYAIPLEEYKLFLNY